ncbi:hypothetical protein [Lacrimispora sp.]|uniref:hypothetical protein n=1 Tax=Lacrimispora sp. TaxID=2719234 RepID=UPI0028A066EF|nr:hypothetical protein [Lacrimispora sp.]
MFNEICIYEAKIEKQEEIEVLMREVAEFYMQQDGVIDVKYIKRIHRQYDFNAVRQGELPIALTRFVGKATYVLHWTIRDEETHARVSKLGLEHFYKRWSRCLTSMPKIILGENIVKKMSIIGCHRRFPLFIYVRYRLVIYCAGGGNYEDSTLRCYFQRGY